MFPHPVALVSSYLVHSVSDRWNWHYCLGRDRAPERAPLLRLCGVLGSGYLSSVTRDYEYATQGGDTYGLQKTRREGVRCWVRRAVGEGRKRSAQGFSYFFFKSFLETENPPMPSARQDF